MGGRRDELGSVSLISDFLYVAAQVNLRCSPPMQEGHHVTGVGDLMAENHESIRGDRKYFLKPEGLILC